MNQYRKKPVVIEAVRWLPDGPVAVGEITAWLSDCQVAFVVRLDDDGDMVLDLPTLEGTMTALPGDWIVRGVAGEFYPCKPDIFDATYEEVRHL